MAIFESTFQHGFVEAAVGVADDIDDAVADSVDIVQVNRVGYVIF
jgi:hypothetical protein